MGPGGTGHRPVASGDPPDALGVPMTRFVAGEFVVPKLGSKLPPRTAKLAVRA
jgi:hypothetical protein